MDWILDEHCKKIIALLIVSEIKFRFNELHRTLCDFGAKMSKPTLILHLRHLQEKGFIIRNEEEKQKVTYEANWQKFDSIKKRIEQEQNLMPTIENKKRFKSLEPKEQLLRLCFILALGEMFRIKIELDDILEPDKMLEHRFSYMLLNKFLDMYHIWFQETLTASTKKDVQELVDTHEKIIRTLMDEIFTSEKPESD